MALMSQQICHEKQFCLGVFSSFVASAFATFYPSCRDCICYCNFRLTVCIWFLLVVKQV